MKYTKKNTDYTTKLIAVQLTGLEMEMACNAIKDDLIWEFKNMGKIASFTTEKYSAYKKLGGVRTLEEIKDLAK